MNLSGKEKKNNKREEVKCLLTRLAIKLKTVSKTTINKATRKTKWRKKPGSQFWNAISLFVLGLRWQGPQKWFEWDNEENYTFNNHKLGKCPRVVCGTSFHSLLWFPSGLLPRQGRVCKCLKPFLVPKNSPRCCQVLQTGHPKYNEELVTQGPICGGNYLSWTSNCLFFQEPT